MNKKTVVAIVLVLSFFCYYKALFFNFWRDDWQVIWALKYYHPYIWFPGWQLHPLQPVLNVIFFKIADSNVLIWQILNLVLKFVSGFAVYLFVKRFLGRERVAFLSAVFFLTTYAGLEVVSWRSASDVSVLIILICVGFYLYLSETKYLAGLLFFTFCLIFDPGRSIPLLLIIPSANFVFLLLRNSLRVNFYSYLFKSLLLIFVLSIIYVNTSTGASSPVFKEITDTLNHFSDLKYYFSSLGNLYLGWLLPVYEWAGVATFSFFTMIVGFLVLFLGIVFLLSYFLSAKNFSVLFSFLIFWSFLFFVPSWFFQKTLSIGGSHRYMALPGVGFVILAAVVIERFRGKLFYLLSAIFICLNLIESNRILLTELTHRSYKLVDAMWSQIDSKVTKNMQGDSVFIIEGDSKIRGSVFDWSNSIPFGILRGISNPDRLPIYTQDVGLVTDLVCMSNVERPTLGGWILEKDRIKIDNVYAWRINDSKIYDISDHERDRIRQYLKQKACIYE